MSIVVLISGRGSNLQAILRAGLPVAGVISDRAAAAGLTLAARRGVLTQVVAYSDYASRETFENALAAEIDRYAPDLVALAGFLRVLSADFVNHYAGRLVNIHPSLLPAFPGLKTHERALAAGVKLHGCTVHFVTAELDRGPIIIQAAVPVRRGDDAAALAARVLAQEHIVYPRAISWFLEGCLVIENGVVHVKGDGTQQLYSDHD